MTWRSLKNLKRNNLTKFFKERENKLSDTHSSKASTIIPKKITTNTFKKFLLNNSITPYYKSDVFNSHETDFSLKAQRR